MPHHGFRVFRVGGHDRLGFLHRAIERFLVSREAGEEVVPDFQVEPFGGGNDHRAGRE